ncbi:SDR family oxidoreductase [Saccharopolyspora taberi]|uniref:NAD(P)H-binding protein n=1 Tax=Saccharopolyspora taberi TaxID=60895 RepID=A0ABN3VFS5_9PSEU
MANSILVTGGTGTLGRAVVRRLLDEGADVRVLSRRARPDAGPGTWATGDLRTGEGVAAAVEGVDAIVHCATTLGRRDIDSMRNLTAAAERAGTRHLIYVSIVGVDKHPLPYYRTKLETEKILAESGVPWTTLRATQFHDLIVKIALVQRWSPVNFTLSGTDFQPIDVRDVAERLVAITLGEPSGLVSDIGGPQVRSHQELVRTCLAAKRMRRLVLPVRMPGAVVAGYRKGYHLAPEHPDGRITFDDFLAELPAA